MVVEASPSAAFIMSKPEFLLELLIVALNAPAQLGEVDQTFEGDVLGKRGEPIFGRLFGVAPLSRTISWLQSNW